MKAWLAKREGKTCPVCRYFFKFLRLSLRILIVNFRVGIDPSTVQRFTVNPADAEAPKQPIDGYAAPQSTRRITYNHIGARNSLLKYVHYSLVSLDPDIFGKIQKVESLGDYGSKIQTLIQHVLYLQIEEPGSKSIVFSAWADSLHSEFSLSN